MKVPSVPSSRSALPPVLRDAVPAACAAGVWFEVLWRTASTSPAPSLPPLAAACVGLATQLAFTALEASLGVAAWGLAGRRAHWRALAPALLTASVTEAFAVGLVAGEPALPETWRVLLAGTRAATVAPPPGAFAQAFAGFGLLALARLALATHAHAAALAEGAGRTLPRGPRWRDAAGLVLAFYAASRLALWWGVDLVRGRSFQP